MDYGSQSRVLSRGICPLGGSKQGVQSLHTTPDSTPACYCGAREHTIANLKLVVKVALFMASWTFLSINSKGERHPQSFQFYAWHCIYRFLTPSKTPKRIAC